MANRSNRANRTERIDAQIGVAQVANQGTNSEKIKQFRERLNLLMGSGYSVLNASEFELTDSNSTVPSSLAVSGGAFSTSYNLFDSKGQPVPVDKNLGTEKLGYIAWGPSDELPNQIYNYAANLPYTAAALKYLSDLTLGYGPKYMYHFIPMDGGSPEDLPYADAGKRILAEIYKIRELIFARQQEIGEDEGNEGNEGGEGNEGLGFVPQQGEGDSTASGAAGDENEIGSLAYFLKEYTEDYKRWKLTEAEHARFIEYNNLEYHYLQCAIDDMHMDIYFPTIGLSIGKKDEDWNPKIMKVGFLPAACCRLEEKDEKQQINYVYYSENWRSNGGRAVMGKKDMVAYPALMQENFMARLRKKVEDNRTTRVGRRPTWFCCPCIYPSMNKPYYPQPAWWSIFPTQIYEYATTLITDKAITRRNATMWGKMVFINLEYLRQLYDDMEADTDEKKLQIRATVLHRVESFLKNRGNNGKPLSADMYPSADGKTLLKSIEIVDVPPLSQGRDMKDEVEELSSLIFFAIGVHPALIGAIPGAKSSSGGTFQRELHLLKQTQMSPRQRIYLRFLENIASFNGWDKKGFWQIAMPVLTTLDRNKTGIEEM